jgi:hypothetical protein
LIGLIFCQVAISGELLALVAALGTAAAVSLTFVGGAVGLLGDIVVTGGAVVALVGSAVAVGPAALAILLALGLTIPFKIPI